MTGHPEEKGDEGTGNPLEEAGFYHPSMMYPAHGGTY